MKSNATVFYVGIIYKGSYQPNKSSMNYIRTVLLENVYQLILFGLSYLTMILLSKNCTKSGQLLYQNRTILYTTTQLNNYKSNTYFSGILFATSQPCFVISLKSLTGIYCVIKVFP